jgi:hypothetical protein
MPAWLAFSGQNEPSNLIITVLRDEPRTHTHSMNPCMLIVACVPTTMPVAQTDPAKLDDHQQVAR